MAFVIDHVSIGKGNKDYHILMGREERQAIVNPCPWLLKPKKRIKV